ncbi:MAG: hypothetical protein J2P53_08570, partial [Bradyrhizobiaceae bacterium]|nr:hypothetical protein [Bradyrhizobiaceae bacterium]
MALIGRPQASATEYMRQVDSGGGPAVPLETALRPVFSVKRQIGAVSGIRIRHTNQSNRLDTDSSLAVRAMASPIRVA